MDWLPALLVLVLALPAVSSGLDDGLAAGMKLTDKDPLKKELEDESRILAAWRAAAVSGLLITGIAPGSQAAIAGIQPGDIITQFGDKAAPTPEEIGAVARATPPPLEIVFSYSRDGVVAKASMRGGKLGISGMHVEQGPPKVDANPTKWEPNWTLLDKGGEQWYITKAGGEDVSWGRDTWKRVGDTYVVTTEGRSDTSHSVSSAKLARVKGLRFLEYVAKQDGVATCRIVRAGKRYRVTVSGKAVERSYPPGALPYDMVGFLERSLPVKPGLVFDSYQINENSGSILGRLHYIMRSPRQLDVAGKTLIVTPLEWVRLGQVLWTTYYNATGRIVSGGFRGYESRTATKGEVLRVFADKPWKP